MADYTQYLMYIPGIVIFLVESGQVRESRRTARPDAVREATVRINRHVTKKDKFDRQVFDYYQVEVESADPKTGKPVRHTVKSPVEYLPGQKVSLYFDRSGGDPVITDDVSERAVNPWLGIIGGALLILLAMFQIQGNEIAAMACLASVLILAGACLIGNYVWLKKKGLQPLESEITGIYERQISKPGRFSGAARFTYYPIVKYVLDGKEAVRRCAVNSGRKESFKVGDSMTLYWSPSEKAVREKKANPVILGAGILVLLAGILAAVSIISAL